MSIYDILQLLVEDDSVIAIYDMGAGEEVFCGEATEAADSVFCDYEVLSFDLCPTGSDPRGVLMVLNIETDGEYLEEDED